MAVKLSSYAKKVLEWYLAGAWNDEMVDRALAKGRITKKEHDSIIAAKQAGA